MSFVMRRVDQRDRTVPRQGAELSDEVGVLAQLCGVAAAKFLPALGIVREPFAELRRGRDLLHPVIERSLLFGDSARPQPVDENAFAVLCRGRVVGPL